jgi:hypothetical protein
MDDRRTLHLLVDELPEAKLPAARRYMERLGGESPDTLRTFLDSAPTDDEPVTREDLEAIRESLQERASGEVVSHEEIQRMVGTE